MEQHRENYWKIAEIEDRFNQLQGGLRTLASSWTLAAFAGLAVLSQVDEKTPWLVPPAVLAWLICTLAVFGLALLWTLDQFVYQKLLGSAFLEGLLLEQRHTDLPPMRSTMLLGSSGGMAKYLKMFYFAPMILFLALGLAAFLTLPSETALNSGALPPELRATIFISSILTAVALVLLYRLSTKVGVKALACSLGVPLIADALENERLRDTIRHHMMPDAKPSKALSQ